jgi:hypothetical protein
VRKKADGNFGRLWIANLVTLAIKVCIAIIGAMLKEDIGGVDLAYINGYPSRPVLTIKKKHSTQRLLVLTFAEALLRFGTRMRKEVCKKPTRKQV